jgi:hypothetical protein
MFIKSLQLEYSPNEVTESVYGDDKVEPWTKVLSAINCNKFCISDQKCNTCNEKMIQVEIPPQGWCCLNFGILVCMTCKHQERIRGI